jgi:hypothetical protein
MTIRAADMLCSVLVACATGFLAGCSSQAPAAETPAAAPSAADAKTTEARPEQALLEDLRNSARLQQAVIAMGGAWKSRAAPHHAGAEHNRTWDYLKRVELKRTGGRVPTSPAPAPARPANQNDATIRDLVGSEDLTENFCTNNENVEQLRKLVEIEKSRKE